MKRLLVALCVWCALAWLGQPRRAAVVVSHGTVIRSLLDTVPPRRWWVQQ